MEATGFWIGLVLGLTVAAILLGFFLNRLSLRRIAYQHRTGEGDEE